MSAPRILFANTTNSTRSTPRLPSKFNVKKAHPTCTVSLANVTAEDRPNTTRSPTPMAPFMAVTNLVPFPCSSADHSVVTIIHPDTSSCIRLPPSLPHSESESSPPGSMTAPHLTPERRKRSTTRLLRPLSLHPTQDSTSDTLQQPPRKRPRLQKGVKGKGTPKSPAKRTSSVPSSDLRFMASVQRSIAYGVKERQHRQGSLPLPLTEGNTDTFEALDILLVGRLRTLLFSCGLKPADLIDLNGDDEMNVDLDTSMDIPVSTDMDIDLEITPGLCRPRSSPPPRPLSAPGPTPPLLTPSQLVASLIIRHHTQRNKSSRSSASSEREGGISRGKPRRPSPLARSIELESDP